MPWHLCNGDLSNTNYMTKIEGLAKPLKHVRSDSDFNSFNVLYIGTKLEGGTIKNRKFIFKGHFSIAAFMYKILVFNSSRHQVKFYSLLSKPKSSKRFELGPLLLNIPLIGKPHRTILVKNFKD